MKKNKKTAIILFVCLLATLSGCKHESVPDNVMDTSKFGEFLTEAHLIESYDYIVVSGNRDSLGYQTSAAFDSLLAKYHISKVDYDSTMAYYMRHPKTFEEIYIRVINRLKDYSNTVPDDINSEDSVTTPSTHTPHSKLIIR